MLFPHHVHKIATKVRDFLAKMSSIQAQNVCTRRVQLFTALRESRQSVWLSLEKTEYRKLALSYIRVSISYVYIYYIQRAQMGNDSTHRLEQKFKMLEFEDIHT